VSLVRLICIDNELNHQSETHWSRLYRQHTLRNLLNNAQWQYMYSNAVWPVVCVSRTTALAQSRAR